MGINVREYVLQQIKLPAEVPDDTNYRKIGAVDSLGLVRLILTLETKFGIMFEDTDVSKPEFNTVGGLVKIIEKKLA